jgi:hypothetical protein
MGGRMKGRRADGQLLALNETEKAHMIVVHDGDRPR